MKNFFKGLTVFTLSLLIFPIVPWLIGAVSTEEALPAYAEISPANEDENENIYYLDEINIYDPVTDRTLTLTVNEYVAASLAAQLAPGSDPELLKAQAVLMYTYILKRHIDETQSPDPELHGCDISTDSNRFPRLILGQDESLDFDIYRNIAKEVEGEYCSYGGEPITVAYCRSAGRMTESALTVLGVDVPYLQATATHEPDNYTTTVTYTSDEVFARLTTSPDGYILLGDPSGWITLKETEKEGYVREVYLDSRFIVSGSELAGLLNLPSAKFTFRYSSATDRFTFTVSGSGSLCGMSQRGAAVLAEEGCGYRDILKHFFNGVEILGGE